MSHIRRLVATLRHPGRIGSHDVGVFVCALSVATAAGCSTESGARIVAWKKPTSGETAPPKVADLGYQVGVGDQILIRTPDNKSGELAEVQGDGAVHLAQHAAVRVDGCTTVEIAQRLVAEADFDRRTDVGVQKYNSQFVHLYGLDETDKSKSIPYRGKETLSELINRVGCKQCRRGVIVKLIRPGTTLGATPDVYTLRLDEDFNSRESSRNLEVQPNDYVYIEKDHGQPATVAEAKQRRAAGPFRWFRPAEPPKQLAKSNLE